MQQGQSYFQNAATSAASASFTIYPFAYSGSGGALPMKELTAKEWLEGQVDEICELAR